MHEIVEDDKKRLWAIFSRIGCWYCEIILVGVGNGP